MAFQGTMCFAIVGADGWGTAQRVGAVRRRAFGRSPVLPLPSRPFGFNPSRLRAYGAARSACL